MVAEFILLLITAYLLGSVPAAYLAAKWSRGIDIREYGSGNVGGSNVLRLTPKWAAIPVLIFDTGKGMLMVWIAQIIGLDIGPQVAIGVAAIIGHNWPVFLNFSGGRGLATTLGTALFLTSINGLIPWEVIAFAVIAAGFYFVARNVPLGTGIGVLAMPLVSWGAGEPPALTLGFFAMFLIMVIRRLAAPKSSLSDSVSKGQLLLNRLLFDRDIRDRDAWVNREPVKRKTKQGKG